MNRSRRIISFAALVLALAPVQALAQTGAWPTERPVRLIVGFPPGGTIDTVARIMAEQIGPAIGGTVVVENRGGAAGMLAAEEVARQAPDGYALLLIPGGPLLDKPPVDVFDDKSFTQIVRLAETPTVLAASATSPYQNVRQVVEESKKVTQPVTYASSGMGSPQHLIGELFIQRAGANLLHVPYRGGGQAISDLVAGHVALGMLGVTPLVPHIKSGRVRALAITGSARVAALPDVPTMKELGIDLVAATWIGIAGPKGLPAPIVDRLAREVTNILAKPDVQARLAPLALTASPLHGPALVEFMRADRDMQMRIVRERNIQLQ